MTTVLRKTIVIYISNSLSNRQKVYNSIGLIKRFMIKLAQIRYFYDFLSNYPMPYITSSFYFFLFLW